MIGGAFEQDDRRAKRQCPGDQPGTHHPAEIRQPEDGVVLLHVEAIGEVMCRLDRETGVGMDRPLGPSRRPGGVKDHAGVVRGGGHGLGRCAVVLHHIVPPAVAVIAPAAWARDMLDDKTLFELRQASHRTVRDILQRHLPATARKPVSGDQQPCIAIGEAGHDRFLAVARE